MAATLGQKATAHGPVPGNAGITALDTSATLKTTAATGSTFIIRCYHDPTVTATAPNDSKGNAYTRIGTQQTAGGAALTTFKCENGVGGSGHYWKTAYSSGTFPGMSAQEWFDTGKTLVVDTGSLVQAADTSSPYTITSGTFDAATTVALLGLAGDVSGNPITFTESTGFTQADSEPDANDYFGGATWYKALAATTALTPSVTFSPGGAAGAMMIFGLKSVSSGGTSLTPGVGSLAITGYAPSIAQPHAVAPNAGSLALTGYAPTIAQPIAVAPGVGSLSISGYAPTVAQTANQGVVPGVGSLAITGYAPTLAQTANQGVNPGVGSLTLTGYAPTVGQTSGATVSPGVGTLSVTGYAPSIAQTANQALSPGVGSIALTGYAPTISQPQAVNPGAGSLSITGYAPSVTQPIAVAAGAGLLSITGYAPALTQTANQAITPDVGSLVLTGYAPSVVQASASNAVNPGAGQITITGYAPDVVQSGGVGGYGKDKKRQKRFIEQAVEAANKAVLAEIAAKANDIEVVEMFDDDEEEILMLLA